MADRRFETNEIHPDTEPDPYGAVIPPIYTAATFTYESPTERSSDFRYGRMDAPTRRHLESTIASLEGATYAFAFASGMAAIDTVFSLLEPGDHIVAGASLYAETHDLLSEYYPRFGIDVTRVDTREVEAIDRAVTPATALIYVETPSNPLLQVTDIAAAAEIATAADALLAVDNTFASPYLQRPIDHGADLVIESLTKYVGGHSDLIAGSVATDDDELAAQLDELQYLRGAIPGSIDSYLAIRGARTLSTRLERQCTSAGALAEFLEEHAMVDRVYYPGLAHHTNHDVADEQMRDFGAMISFEIAGGRDPAAEFLDALEVFTLAESLGAVESLIEVPALMTHQHLDDAALRAAGIPPGLVRVSVGTEHEADLRADLEQGLRAIDT